MGRPLDSPLYCITLHGITIIIINPIIIKYWGIINIKVTAIYYNMDFPVIKFLIALAIGALVGIERERRIKRTEFAGIRTFMLISLVGALSAYLSGKFFLAFPVAFLGIILLIVVSYTASTREGGDIGVTGEVAALVTFLLGAMCVAYDYRLAVMLSIIVTAILALKRYIHVAVRRISEREMIDTIKFLIIAFVILPLLPDTATGP
ncbi:unknown [Methanothermobacter thermautotrophicus str. Delta H]|uniref:MgtC/SapB/SrpB/YhiD N-terminal domain-containing protein n=1 Tax=Methanothermobacter thermautotrophicus (strain ATCC 29096 / DSM 1053 / JCM 10044 / NBRC 100330 / Delta H) TaxID=187420 RepID=O27499_METTH|nr:unknown [Methanothermobacter thermautotrophicus str. Delta H]